MLGVPTAFRTTVIIVGISAAALVASFTQDVFIAFNSSAVLFGFSNSVFFINQKFLRLFPFVTWVSHRRVPELAKVMNLSLKIVWACSHFFFLVQAKNHCTLRTAKE